MSNPIIDSIKKRINHQNKNWLAIICGETGSGKSYSALKLAELIDHSFNIDRVVFRVEDFMALLNSGELKKGNVIVFDEAGVGIPAREWYSISNKAINYVFQTFRHENLGVIFTTPSFDFIDSQTRKLFHNYIETVSINRKEEYVVVKFFEIQFSPRFGKVYFKYPRIDVNGEQLTVKRMKIYKPSDKLAEEYEEKKKLFTKELKKDVERDVRKSRERETTIKPTPKEIAEQILANQKQYIKIRKNGKKWVDVNLIELNFPVGHYVAMRSKKLVESILNRKNEREGYSV